jgi:hypothetical protein
MKAFGNKTKTAATIVTLLVALTGAALAHGASTREAPGAPDLQMGVLALAQVEGFWTADCPIAFREATEWAQGDDVEASALQSEGFAIGVRELLRSDKGDTGLGVALRFRSAAGARADLDRRERLAGHRGYAVNFAVPGSPSVRAYTVRTKGSTTVHVAFARGTDEYAIAVEAAHGTNVDALQRALATAIRREARHVG